MNLFPKAPAIAALIALASPAAADFVTKTSDRSVVETMDALEAAVTEAGATVFARVDHARGAEQVQMELPASQLLIFGNPKLGTPAMQDDLRAGLVLPLRVLVFDDGGQTRVMYEEVEEMFDDLDIDDDAEYFEKMEGALDNLTDAAVSN